MISRLLQLVLNLLSIGLLINTNNNVSTPWNFFKLQYNELAFQFNLPLGQQDGVAYGPRINYRNGQLIEDSEYGVLNPDMQGNTCFGVDWGQIYHAGEDWYRLDGLSTWQAEVTAVTNGIVKYIGNSFPGAVIIIEHNLPPDGQQKIYSIYGHLDVNSVIVSIDQEVVIGQFLGSVMQQFFAGRYTDYHDDSHLHFEMRYFYDASNIYTNYPACNNYLPGRGYTYPQHPDDFPPSQSLHYTDPIEYIQNRQYVFLPAVLKFQACMTGRPMISNGSFESGNDDWLEQYEPGYPVITNHLLPISAHNGTWVAWFGGRNNAVERIYQQFTVLLGMSGADFSYFYWMKTDETLSGLYDKLYVRLRDSNDNIVQELDYLDNNTYRDLWVYRTIPVTYLAAYQGQTLRLSFEGTTDSSFITSFFIDDVSLTAICSGAQAPQLPEELATPTNPPQATPTGANPTKPVSPTSTITPTSIPYP